MVDSNSGVIGGYKMISKMLNKTSLPLLSKQLDFNAKRHRIIAENIANVNTPEYLAKDLTFEDTLKGRLRVERTHPTHLPMNTKYKFKEIDNPDKEIKNGINNVDIDHEMVEVARNQMEFEFGSSTGGYNQL